MKELVESGAPMVEGDEKMIEETGESKVPAIEESEESEAPMVDEGEVE